MATYSSEGCADAMEAAGQAPQPEYDPAIYPDDAIADLRQCAVMIRTWIPEVYPANEAGQVPFARAVMESVAAAIDRVAPPALKPE